MDYLISIMSAVIIFPLLALIITVPFILYNYHKYAAIYYFRSFIIYSFVLYLLISYFLVILPLPDINSIDVKAQSMQLIPFEFIYDFINKSGFILTDLSTYLNVFTSSYFYVPLFNILLFIPFGMYLRYYFNCNIKKTIILSFLLSLFFELTQLTGLYFIYPHSYRLFDVDDLMLNTLGGIIGYYLFSLFKKVLPSSKEIEEETNKRRVKISTLKRITLFLLDLIIFNILYWIVYIIFPCNYYIGLIIYYIIIPYLVKGQTVGSKFLHIVLVSNDNLLKFYQIVLRNGLFILFLFVIPNYFIIFTIIVYIFNFIYYLKKKQLFYEKVSNTELKSTFALKNIV